MFLNEGTVVFSLFMILFVFSRFIFCSCDSISSWLLGCVLFGSVVFSFSEVGIFFFVGLFLFDVSGTVLWFYVCVFDGFLRFQSQKTNPS